MSMNENTNTPPLTADDLAAKYIVWYERFQSLSSAELITGITRITRTITEKYPNYSNDRTLMLKKLEAMQDVALLRMDPKP